MFVPSVVGNIVAAMESLKAREEWINSLPVEEAEKIREQDRLRFEENEKHRKALEIANASRARNFWGD
jgi:hypothetical protein